MNEEGTYPYELDTLSIEYMNLNDLEQWMTSLRERVGRVIRVTEHRPGVLYEKPPEFVLTAEILAAGSFETRHYEYESGTYTGFVVRRPFTSEEWAAHNEAKKKAERHRQNDERATYERLKKKFG